MKRYQLYPIPVYFLMGILTFLAACKSKFNPKQPEEKYNHSETVIQKQLSAVNIPVEITVDELQRTLNNQVQGLIFEDNKLDNNGNDNLLLKVWKRENITIGTSGDLFSIIVPLKIWAKVGYTFDKFGIKLSEFRETDFEMNVRFVSKISVTQDWQVQTTTSPNGFDWIKKPYIRIGPIEIPVAPIVEKIIDGQQETIAKDLDKQVKEQFPLKKYIQQAWTQMQTPFQVSQEYNTWLKVTPTEIVMTPLNGQGDKIKAIIGVKGYTETFIGRQPEAKVNPTLPPLQISPEIPDDFTIGLSGEVSHAYATQLVAKQFVNQTFESGKYKVTIMGIDLYGSGDNLIIKADLAGSVNGKIYLKGKPYYDPKTQLLTLQKLDFDLDTKDKLVKTANWLLHGTMVRKMQDAFKIPVGNQLEEAKKVIQEQLNNKQVAKGIYLNGQLAELTPSGVIITPESIVAIVLAKGKLDVKIAGLL